MMPVFELVAGSPASEEEWAVLMAAVLQLQHRQRSAPVPQVLPAPPALRPWQRAGRLDSLLRDRNDGTAFWTED